MPGGLLASEGSKWRPYGFQNLYNEEDIYNILPHAELGPHNHLGLQRVEVVRRRNPKRSPRTKVYLKALHLGHTDPNTGYAPSLEYRIPVLSKRHLSSLIGDLPESVRNQIVSSVERADPNLPDDHAEQLHRRRIRAKRMSRKK